MKVAAKEGGKERREIFEERGGTANEEKRGKEIRRVVGERELAVE